ncbi:hypothetical protein A5876_001981, partial [Enterococcus sp. 3C8_DIV0646]
FRFRFRCGRRFRCGCGRRC